METQKDTSTLQRYILGYSLSILFTLAAFGLAYIHISSDHIAISHTFLHYAIALLAVIQLVIQSVFFLHLSHRTDQRSNLITFIFMILIVILIAGGSIWILNNLNSNMSPEQVAKYMHNEN